MKRPMVVVDNIAIIAALWTPLSGAELATLLRVERRAVDRALSILLSAGSITFDGRTNCYSRVNHEPNLDTHQ